MKTTNDQWMKTARYQLVVTVAMLLLGSASTVRAVNGDPNPPCWRDWTSTTRQAWDFERDVNPIDASTDANPAGTPSAAITLGVSSSGYTTNSCIKSTVGCGDVVIAVLPLNGTTECSGPPYLAYTNGFGPDRLAYTFNEEEVICTTTGAYNDPATYGTAYGFWDVGTTSGKIVMSIPNSGAPNGTIRYFYVQGTFLRQDTPLIGGGPGVWAVTNSAGVGNTTSTILTPTTNTVEIPLNKYGDKIVGNRSWVGIRRMLKVDAATASGTDKVTLRGAGQFVTESVIVETLDRAAVTDDLGNVANATTNIPFATLLGNDRGSTNIVGAGSAVNGSVSAPSGGVVSFTPTSTGAASFWYTNSDCAGLTNLAAQVTFTVTSANIAPVANPDFYSRVANLSLKIRKTDLVANDTDADGGTVVFSAVAGSTTNGQAITSDATYIYIQTNNVTDAFYYTNSDGQGGFGAGLVVIELVPAAPMLVLGLTPNTNSTVTVNLAGIPTYPYAVERGTNVSFSPLTRTWATNAPTNGLFQVIDDFSDLGTPPYTPAEAYYRMRYNP